MEIVSAFDSSFIINDRGVVFACGANNSGQLGLRHNNDKNEFIPVDMSLLEGDTVKGMDCCWIWNIDSGKIMLSFIIMFHHETQY